jgi:hypothetical protein
MELSTAAPQISMSSALQALAPAGPGPASASQVARRAPSARTSPVVLSARGLSPDAALSEDWFELRGKNNDVKFLVADFMFIFTLSCTYIRFQ